MPELNPLVEICVWPDASWLSVDDYKGQPYMYTDDFFIMGVLPEMYEAQISEFVTDYVQHIQ